uniref:Peptidase S1 domain-containing protein n=1 Tax=Glossina pallidipes TaxID=7398 RepID=A0A1A9ZNR4_GLOPL
MTKEKKSFELIIDKFLPHTRQSERICITGGTSRHALQDRMVKFINVHESFDKDYSTHDDIAVVWLKNPITGDGEFRDIAPLTSHPSPQLDCVAIGWGRLYADSPLTALEMPISQIGHSFNLSETYFKKLPTAHSVFKNIITRLLLAQAHHHAPFLAGLLVTTLLHFVDIYFKLDVDFY